MPIIRQSLPDQNLSLAGDRGLASDFLASQWPIRILPGVPLSVLTYLLNQLANQLTTYDLIAYDL